MKFELTKEIWQRQHNRYKEGVPANDPAYMNDEPLGKEYIHFTTKLWLTLSYEEALKLNEYCWTKLTYPELFITNYIAQNKDEVCEQHFKKIINNL